MTMALVYPYKNPPSKSSVFNISPEVKWLRQPLPMSLGHINCYLIKDGDGWCIVDTGMNLDEAKTQWIDIIENELDGGPITRVIVTHQHPDHVGLAGFLCDTLNVSLWMSEIEYFYTRTFAGGMTRSVQYWETDRYLTRTCMAQATRDAMFSGKANGFSAMVSEMPASFCRIADQQMLQIGEHQWKAITTRGHSPEHVSLYCKELDLLISGDQVLPIITSNVSVSPIQPDASPLIDWLLAHDKIKEQVPDSVLVLPSHQLPFKNLHERLDEVVEHHEERLDKLLTLCESGQNAQSLTIQLFERELDPFQNFMAVGECVSHLHCLMERGKLIRTLDTENDHYLFQVS